MERNKIKNNLLKNKINERKIKITFLIPERLTLKKNL